MKALVIGQVFELTIALPDVLTRAGFEVDVVTTRPGLRYIKIIRAFYYVSSEQALLAVAEDLLSLQYQLIVIADDRTLKLILDSNLSDAQKIRMLPVTSVHDFSHLYSKIALSQLFKKMEIPTPKFLVAQNITAIKADVLALGFPVLIKIDQSSAGKGVFECVCMDDVERMDKKIKRYPVLVQKKVNGKSIDVSGFFQNGQLIHCDYAAFDRVCLNPYGPSVLRNYTPLINIESAVIDEVSRIGSVLGAHGFSNISCIQSEIDGKRYYIEADLRPNVWVGFSKYFTTDIALQIKRYFEKGFLLNQAEMKGRFKNNGIVLPYTPRMRLNEIVLNRYYCWKYIDKRMLIIGYLMALGYFKRFFLCLRSCV